VTKKARQLSTEGLEAISKRPWHHSAEGLQVVPGSSPEVVQRYTSNEKIPADGSRTKSIKTQISIRNFMAFMSSGL
jgi:hypothetical protein